MRKILLYLGDAYFINGVSGVGAVYKNIFYGLNSEYDLSVPENFDEQMEKMLPKNAHPLMLSHHKRKQISRLKWFVSVDKFFSGYDIILTDSFSFKPSKNGTRLFMLVHDCMWATDPANYNKKSLFYFKLAARTFKWADKIIAVSHSTKQALHDVFHISYSKIETVLNASDFACGELYPTKNYFLYIGDMRKIKNLKNLILGYKIYRDKFNGKETLVIAGNKKNEYENLVKIVEENNLQENVIFPGYIDEFTKKRLFCGAMAVVLMSDNEGFGIPLIEAQRNGIPVVCSDIPVFHEVLNEETAVFADNKNSESIAKALVESKNLKPSQEISDFLKNRYSLENYYKSINKVFGL